MVLLMGNGQVPLQLHEARALLSENDVAAAEAAQACGAPFQRCLGLRLVRPVAAGAPGGFAAGRSCHQATLALQHGALRLFLRLPTQQALGQPAALRLRREGGTLVVEPADASGLPAFGEDRKAVVWALTAGTLSRSTVLLPAAAVQGPLRTFVLCDSGEAVKVDVQVADEPGRVLRMGVRRHKSGTLASGIMRWLRERGAAAGDRLRLSLLADGSLAISLLRRAAGPQRTTAGGNMKRTASEAAAREGPAPAPSPAAVSEAAPAAVPTGKRRREEGTADHDRGGSGAEEEAGGSRRAAHPSRVQGSAAATPARNGGGAQPSTGTGAAAAPHQPTACMAAPLLRKRVALSPAQAQALGLRGPGGAYAQGRLPLRVAGGEAGPSAGGCPGAAHTVTLEEREGALVLRLGRQARKALGAAEALWLWREGGGLAASPAPAGAAEAGPEAEAAAEPGTEGLAAAPMEGPGEAGSGVKATPPEPGQDQPTGKRGNGGQAPAPDPIQQGGGQGEGSGPGVSGPLSVTWPLDQASLDHRPFLPESVTLGPLYPLLHGRPSARVHVAVADQPGRPLALRVKQEAGTGRYRARGLRGWLRERGARAGDLLTLTHLPEGGLVLRLDHQAGTAPEAAPEPPTTAPEPAAQGRGAAPAGAHARSLAALAAQLPTCGKRPPEGGTAGQAEAKRARKKEKGGDRAKGRRSPTQPHPLGESPPLLPAPSLSAVHLQSYPLPPSAPAAPPALQPGELRLCGLTFHPALAPAVRRSLAAWEAALCEQLRGEGLDGGLSDAAPEALQVCVLDGARLREAGIREYVVRCQLAHLLGLADAFDKDLPPHAPQLGPDRLAPGPDAGRGGAGLFAAVGLRKGAVLGVLGGYVMPGAEARRFAARGWQALGAEARAELEARAGGGAAASGGGAGQHVRSAWELLEGSMRLPMPGSPDGWQLSMLGYGSLAALINDPRHQPRGWLEGSDLGDEGGAAARAANCTVVPVRVRGLALPVVVAVRDVAPGEQLLRDYGAEWWREREEAWCSSSTTRDLPGLKAYPPAASGVGSSLVSMAGAAVLANAGRHAAWLQALAEGEDGDRKGRQSCNAAALAQPPPPAKPQRGGTRSLPGGSRPPSGAVAAAVALALSNARRLGEAWANVGRTRIMAARESASRQGEGLRWKPHELEIVVRAAKQLPTHTSREDTKRILAELGWPSDPRMKVRLRYKMLSLRALKLNGYNPEDVLQKRKRRQNKSMTYKAWAIQALRSLPGRQGTAGEIGAILLADPDIGPKLDLRNYAGRKSTPQWLMSLRSTLAPEKGFVTTGLKRDGQYVFAYDPVVGRGRPALLLRHPASRRATRASQGCLTWARGAGTPTEGSTGHRCRALRGLWGAAPLSRW
ncbi:hypothetical protein HYH03_014901 [Edaphochlamys debaryana]|uniref:SET domain-containing protein n=1 Tax=Edaphochlamys debaryana TaxID=47281 RepID=A0A835XV82_9CHLO|nr:hypothetical protein HYH03_014901 [Edaphochlamys debaryana]|eukprot:KAG2486454.1 hypothetical protein HYH03_014901 [Edaphochlamys debaryana]